MTWRNIEDRLMRGSSADALIDGESEVIRRIWDLLDHDLPHAGQLSLFATSDRHAWRKHPVACSPRLDPVGEVENPPGEWNLFGTGQPGRSTMKARMRTRWAARSCFFFRTKSFVLVGSSALMVCTFTKQFPLPSS